MEEAFTEQLELVYADIRGNRKEKEPGRSLVLRSVCVLFVCLTLLSMVLGVIR